MTGDALRVLVVDDERPALDELVYLLGTDERVGTVKGCDSASEALRVLHDTEVDVVFLDVKMPVLDGLTAAEQIVSARIAPVVILTAFSQRDLVERAREAGAMAYLVKPFSSKDLRPTVEMAVSRFAEISALEAISLIGGVTDSRANPKGILVLRDYPTSAVQADGSGPTHERVVFTLDLTTADGLFSAGQFPILSGDLVYATESPLIATGTVLGLVGTVFGLGNAAQNL